MKKFFLRTIILLLIFISAVAGYFIWIRNHNLSDGSRRVYTVIQESTFPVMYMEMYGEKMNCLHGYSLLCLRPGEAAPSAGAGAEGAEPGCADGKRKNGADPVQCRALCIG